MVEELMAFEELLLFYDGEGAVYWEVLVFCYEGLGGMGVGVVLDGHNVLWFGGIHVGVVQTEEEVK